MRKLRREIVKISRKIIIYCIIFKYFLCILSFWRFKARNQSYLDGKFYSFKDYKFYILDENIKLNLFLLFAAESDETLQCDISQL